MSKSTRGSFKSSVLNLCLKRDIDYHKRSHKWYTWDFYHTNQLEIKITDKNSTKAFGSGLKFGTQLEINKTSHFSKVNLFWNKIGGICS